MRTRIRLAVLIGGVLSLGLSTAAEAPPVTECVLPDQVILKGPLGIAVEASRNGRLRTFIADEKSPPLALFGPEAVAKNDARDWKGEHVGKWLYASARAARRTGDGDLLARVKLVADYLVSQQGKDGYLGTYSPATRMTAASAYRQPSWDVWVHSYLLLGLLELDRLVPDPKYRDAACQMGDLLVRLFGAGDKSVAYMGNHAGLSGTILLEPMVELYRTTQDARYLDFAEGIVRQMDARPELQLLARTLRGTDLSEVGDGKIYQLCWNYAGLVKLHEVTGNPSYLKAARLAWDNLRQNHLTPAGGPWGGIARHWEAFNAPDFFSPYGFVETCSTMAWLQWNIQMLRLTGEAAFAEEIERATWNALLGAMDPNGEDWSYHTFANGRRTRTYYWACCKSSGAMALEELPPVVFTRREGGLAINLYTESEARVPLEGTNVLQVIVNTRYPAASTIDITVNPPAASEFPLFLRIPSWAEGASLVVGGEAITDPVEAGSYVMLKQTWAPGTRLRLNLPMKLTWLARSHSAKQEEAEVVRMDYAAIVRGPLVYATGPVDGFRWAETVRLPRTNPESLLALDPAASGIGPAIQLRRTGATPIPFRPYAEVGRGQEGAWRLMWLGAAYE